MSTVQQITARATREAAAALAETVQAMPPEKQVWQPLDAGRSALSQLQECAVLNTWFARMLRERVVSPLDDETYGRQCGELDTVDRALAALNAGACELADAIEAVPDTDLAKPFKLPWMEATIADVARMAEWNMTYHLGQISYIQTLYGDKNMHMKAG